MQEITAKQAKQLLTDGDEIAFLDVREHGQYGEGHPFFCVSLPYSRIEALAPRLMPSQAVRCVLLDDGDGVAQRAAAVLDELGYRDVAILRGGAPAWARAGFTLFKGVNVPSKTFGELVEHAFETPSISAEDLQRARARGDDMLVLDGRSAREFEKMSLPGAQSCPNAELGYRLPMLAPDAAVPIIVNCAGRTRSIIGAQTLRLLDTPNPVFALRNGTQGWRLSGFDLIHGAQPTALPTPSSDALSRGAEMAARLIERYRLSSVDLPTLRQWQAEQARSTFLFDVRDPHEYAAGHIDGARSAPGGQLVQATDEFTAVRNARIVLTCDNGLRAATTAIWLAGMGHSVWLLEPGAPRAKATASPSLPNVSTIDAADVKARVDNGVKVLDVSPGMRYRNGHIEGAVWATRARLDPDLIDDADNWVLVGQDATLIIGVLAELRAAGGQVPASINCDSAQAWRAAGLRIVETPESPSDAECIDHLFFVHDRHDGNLEASRQYLAWELGLLEQLDAQERGVLQPLQPATSSQPR